MTRLFPLFPRASRVHGVDHSLREFRIRTSLRIVVVFRRRPRLRRRRPSRARARVDGTRSQDARTDRRAARGRDGHRRRLVRGHRARGRRARSTRRSNHPPLISSSRRPRRRLSRRRRRGYRRHRAHRRPPTRRGRKVPRATTARVVEPSSIGRRATRFDDWTRRDVTSHFSGRLRPGRGRDVVSAPVCANSNVACVVKLLSITINRSSTRLARASIVGTDRAASRSRSRKIHRRNRTARASRFRHHPHAILLDDVEHSGRMLWSLEPHRGVLPGVFRDRLRPAGVFVDVVGEVVHLVVDDDP